MQDKKPCGNLIHPLPAHFQIYLLTHPTHLQNNKILSPRAWLAVISQKRLVIFSDAQALLDSRQGCDARSLPRLFIPSFSFFKTRYMNVPSTYLNEETHYDIFTASNLLKTTLDSGEEYASTSPKIKFIQPPFTSSLRHLISVIVFSKSSCLAASMLFMISSIETDNL